jgi:hypothetical protein
LEQAMVFGIGLAESRSDHLHKTELTRRESTVQVIPHEDKQYMQQPTLQYLL